MEINWLQVITVAAPVVFNLISTIFLHKKVDVAAATRLNIGQQLASLVVQSSPTQVPKIDFDAIGKKAYDEAIKNAQAQFQASQNPGILSPGLVQKAQDSLSIVKP